MYVSIKCISQIQKEHSISFEAVVYSQIKEIHETFITSHRNDERNEELQQRARKRYITSLGETKTL